MSERFRKFVGPVLLVLAGIAVGNPQLVLTGVSSVATEVTGGS